MSDKNFIYKRFSGAEAIVVTSFPNTPQLSFFRVNRIIISLDQASSGTILSFSFKKPFLSGEIFCSDGPIVFDGLGEDRIWFKVNSGSAELRFWAWRL